MSAALWQPKYQDYKDALLAAEALTEDDLRAAMLELPDEIRATLARGPIPRRWDCGICEAFGKPFYCTGAVDLTDPRWIVWIYHEVPKAHMKRNDQLHYGHWANETYVRCIATYRAAGWSGDAEEPNA